MNLSVRNLHILSPPHPRPHTKNNKINSEKDEEEERIYSSYQQLIQLIELCYSKTVIQSNLIAFNLNCTVRCAILSKYQYFHERQ